MYLRKLVFLIYLMYQTLLQQNASLSALLSEVSQISQYLWHKGWAERNAGNISVSITDLLESAEIEHFNAPVFRLPMTFPGLAGEVFFTTGTGRRMRDIHTTPLSNTLIIQLTDTADRYRVISHDQQQLGDLRPTSELSSHLSIHQFLKQRKASKKVVVHTHPNELIALTHSPVFKDEKAFNHMIWSMHPEAVVFIPGGAGIVPYFLTGSNDLGLETLKALENHDVVVWEKHGCLAVAAGLGEAFDLIDILNKSADIYLKCRTAGIEPEGLTDKQIEALRNL